jgi:hypothetical protein
MYSKHWLRQRIGELSSGGAEERVTVKYVVGIGDTRVDSL